MAKTRSSTSPIPRGRSVAPPEGVAGTGCTSANATGTVYRAWVLGRRLRKTDTTLQPRERSGCPPVEVAEEAHRRRHDEGADEGRVDPHGESHAEPDRLDEDDVRERERREDPDHDRRRAGDEATALLEAGGDSTRVIARPQIFLLHPR